MDAKNYRVMEISVSQGETISEFIKILISQNFAKFLKFSLIFFACEFNFYIGPFYESKYLALKFLFLVSNVFVRIIVLLQSTLDKLFCLFF